jgi:HD superfamily phosphohydrolase YqeK
MSWELILTKGLNIALGLGFFLAITFFLRFLYGPKGRFRDPQWDVWNEEARLALAKELDAKEYAALREAFTAYARSWFSDDPEQDRHLGLKLEHSSRVFAHASELAACEPALADPEVSRALKIAALFHDVARFEQYVKYKTFADELSYNHGVVGAKIVLRQGFIKNEPPPVRRLVLGAVALHNRLALPDSLPEKLRLVLSALRDADKLDILRVMEGHLKPDGTADNVVLLHLKDEPKAYSPAVLSALEQRRVALYRDMRYYNDFRIVLCTWLFELHFPTALRIAQQGGYIEHIIDGLAALPEVQEKARAATRMTLEPEPL